MKRLALALLAATALTACKTQIATDLYTADLADAAADPAAALTAPLTLGLAISGNCDEKAAQILPALQTATDSAEFIGCERVDFDTLARFRVQAPLIPAMTETDAPISISVERSGASLTVGYRIDMARIRMVWDNLPEDMTRFETFRWEPDLAATLTNDLRGAVSVTTNDVFADGIPVQGTQTKTLDRRGQIELHMSDVTNAAFGTTDAIAQIATITLPD